MLAWDIWSPCFYLPSPGISGMCLFMGLGNWRKGAGQDVPSCTSLSAVGHCVFPLCPPGSCQLSSSGGSKLLEYQSAQQPVLQQDWLAFLSWFLISYFFFFCFSSSRIWVDCLFHFKFSSSLNSLQNSIPAAKRPWLLLYSKIQTSVYLKFKHELTALK